MAVFSAFYGGLIAYRMFNTQDDFIFDILKVFIAVGFATAVLAFIFWSLLLRKKEGYIQAALAGILTAVCVLPVPAFIWAVKSQFHSLLNSDIGMLLSGIGDVLSLTAENFLWSFSLAEAITLPMSAAVGLFVIWNS